ncbi:hypothetical protein BY996DRAFT_3327321 [Phakopsora pachyrhizi]|nr:hypothetical protein BY996DRAFT_3327321 [Phakopsora pachyrhizi]
MTLAISQLFASIMTSIYICMIHRSNEDAVFRVKAPLTACLGLIYYFEFISFWIFSWSSLYTWLYSEASYATKLKAGCKRTISPLYFNLVFISIPTIVLFINCFCICFISKATRLFAQVWFGLVEELHSGSHIWKNLRENSRSQQAQTRLTDNLIASIKRSLDFYPELLKRLNSSIVIMKFICAYWTTAMVIIFVVMTFSLWNLLVVSYRSINKEQPESQNVPIVLESNSLSDGCSSKKISGVVSTENSHSLVIKRRLVHLSIRSGAMLLAILGTITISFIGAIHTKLVVTNQSWRSAISVIPLFIATVAALPITFQCWRVYSENKLLTHGKNQSEDSAIINRECMESVSEINVLRIRKILKNYNLLFN